VGMENWRSKDLPLQPLRKQVNRCLIRGTDACTGSSAVSNALGRESALVPLLGHSTRRL